MSISPGTPNHHGKDRAASIDVSRQNAASGKNISYGRIRVLKEKCAGSASLAFGHGIRQPGGEEPYERTHCRSRSRRAGGGAQAPPSRFKGHRDRCGQGIAPVRGWHQPAAARRRCAVRTRAWRTPRRDRDPDPRGRVPHAVGTTDIARSARAARGLAVAAILHSSRRSAQDPARRRPGGTTRRAASRPVIASRASITPPKAASMCAYGVPTTA